MTSFYGLLDVLIVLSGLYTGLSCFVSWTNERIAEFLSLRGKTLFSGVLNLVMGEASLANGIFTHPLITAARNDKNGKPDFGKPYRPSYLDARNFSLALWQTVDRRQTGGAATIADTIQAPSALLADLASRVDALENADLRKALTALVQQAGNDYQLLLTVTDSWFNAQMDRVTGWYKRQSQYVVAAIALVLVSITGLDSVEIATRLSSDPAMRAEFAAEVARSVPATSTLHGSGSTPSPSALEALATEGTAQAQNNFASFFHVAFNGDKWRHVPGMFVTLVALTLGGPFWFDLLGSLVNVRGAGRKPERGDQDRD